ncbi:fibronectin type III domain-containing protein [Corynebacterium sp. HS2168-gen11]|uniref:fibronectin type III domain-containing protein n=1 Tax=Corynebacterium sp. HS2168-gen11 TaxID=2974027 RepID=UPI00216B3B10|nr:fibronectin type III domain-containing protein [Corynebacterium sp. HS2168-gen11]MCS4534896.1 fibronectin type III domain-containing protein [Corynebacterium sp. HS2168-gen11]
MHNKRWRTAIISSTTVLALSLGTTAPVVLATDAVSAQQPAGTKGVYVRADGTTVRITWETVTGANHYTVELIDTATDRTYQSEKNTVHTTEYFTNVVPGTYKARIVTWTSNTEYSTPSESQPVTVSADVTVPEAPDAPVLELLRDQNIHVEWRQNSTGGLGLLSQEITLTPEDGTAPITKVVPANVEEAIVSGVTVGKAYKATVKARNALGDSPASEASTALTVTEDPADIQLTVTPHEVDPTQENTFVVEGIGYTGAAAQNGLYIVVRNRASWDPGHRPTVETFGYATSIEVAPDEIHDGHFSKQITVPANSFDLQPSLQYLVGTIAGGKAIAYDRRYDRAMSIRLKGQPAESVTARAEGRKIVASWEPPSSDTRAREYRIELYPVTNGQRETQVARTLTKGPMFRNAEFLDLRPGTYVVSVRANISSNDWDVNYTEPVFSQTVTIAPPEQHAPDAPQSVRIDPGATDNSARVSWLESDNDGGAALTGFNVILRSEGKDPIVRQVGPNESLLDISDVPAGTWTAEVYAVNKIGSSIAGTSEASATITGESLVADPQLTVEDKLLDTSKPQTLTVSGTDYGKTSTVMLAIVDVADETTKILEQEVRITAGAFSHELAIPAKTLDPTKKYAVLTYKGETELTKALLKLADPIVAKPVLTADTTTIDAAKGGTIEVSGTGYTGDGAAQGVYVVVYNTTDWTPGTIPAQSKKFIGAQWVKIAEIRDGAFTKTVTIPAGVLAEGQTYAIGTFAAHALSQTNRSLDASLPLTVTNATVPSQNDQSTDNTNGNNAGNSGDTGNTGNTGDTGNSGSGNSGVDPQVSTTPETPGTTPKPPAPYDTQNLSSLNNKMAIIASIVGIFATIAGVLGLFSDQIQKLVAQFKHSFGF